MSQETIEVEGPDGSVYEFPMGTSPEVYMSYIKASTPAPISNTESFMQGLRDPIDAGAQLLTKVLPNSLVNAGNALNNKLAEYGIVAPVSESGVAEDIAAKERLLQTRRKSAGQTGVDWARVGGNVLSPANLALGATAVPMGLGGRAAVAGIQGAISEPLSDTNDFTEQKLRQAGLGVVGGIAGEAAGRVLGRVISPAASRNPDIRALVDEGVTPTIGHMVGPRATSVERAMQISPILGSSINLAEKRTFDDFNRAVSNRILRNVGEVVPKTSQVGTELFDATNRILGSKYDELLPKLKGSIDPDFQSELSTIKSMTASMPPQYEELFDKIVKTDLLDRFTTSGLASGETVKAIEGSIGKRASDYSKSLDPDQRQLGTALKEVQSSLRTMLERQNPDHSGELQKINKAWASLVRMENATASAGAQKRSGVFSPEEYLSAIKSADNSLRKRNVAKGTALDQDFAQSAQRVLGKDTGGFLSPWRMAGALGMIGNYMSNPAIAGAEVALSLPYSKVGQRALAEVMTNRPPSAGALRDIVRKASPLVSPAVISPLQQYRDTKVDQVYKITE